MSNNNYDYDDIAKKYYDKFTGWGLPPQGAWSMAEYLVRGTDPGGFICSVMSNDLVGAFGRADSTNIELLKYYAKAVYNEAPTAATGSYDKVSAWMEHGGLAGRGSVAFAHIKTGGPE